MGKGTKSSSDDDVVISGLSGRFPMSDDLDEFAQNLYDGVDMVTGDESRYPKGFWNIPERIAKIKSYDKFDSLFFGYTNQDTYWIDPKERVMLEATYEALIDAGIAPETIRGSNTGVYHGSCFQEPHIGILEPLSIVKAFASCVSRINYHFDLKGPVFHIDTACASSFCSFHEAIMAVKSGYCDMVIATGSNTCFQPFISYQMSDLKMISDEGKSKSLDASADGYARSEAVVVVIIQRRKDAKRVYGTILNSKSNSDGYKVEGITFPGTAAQVSLVKSTYDEIDLNLHDIKYIEAHATGTAAGDPIELNSMYDVLCSNKQRINDPILVGCVKTNLGHGEGASGLVSLAKAMIVLQNNLIPPNIHFKTPNPEIKGLMDGQFVPVTQVTPLPGDLITLNSFGFGGSNIHTVVKSEKRINNFYDNQLIASSNMPRLVLACGRNHQSVQHIYSYIEDNQKTHTRDFLYLVDQMAQVSIETGMSHRGYMMITSTGDSNDLVFEKIKPVKVTYAKPLVLFFPGVNHDIRQHNHVLKQLMNIQTFADSINKSKSLLRVFNIQYDSDFNPIVKSGKNGNRDVIMSNGQQEVDDDPNNNFIKSSTTVDETLSASMLHTMVQIALVDVMKSLEIKPQNLIGYSVGELAVAYFNQDITDHQALLLSYSNHTLGKRNRQELYKMISRIMSGNKHRTQQTTPEYLTEKLLNPTNGFGHIPKHSLIIECSSKGLIQKPWGDRITSSLSDMRPGIKTTLAMIGNIYINGQKPRIEKIYPKVQLPLPSCTPSVSPLIKWDHRMTYKLSQTHLLDTTTHGQYTMMCKNIPFHFDPRLPEDSFLLDHKIDGRSLFPATGYLMIAYSTLCKLLNKRLDDVPVEMTDIKFSRMIMLSPHKELDFLVRLNEDTGHFEIKERETIVVTGTIRRLEDDGCLNSHPDMSDFEPERDPIQLLMTTRDIYKEYRVRGYDYQPYFNGIHSALSDGVEGTVIWRDIMPTAVRDNFPVADYDQQWLRQWLVFVDCMCQVNLLSNKKAGRGLFVPTQLKSLICYPKVLKRSIAENSGHPDSLVMGKSSHIKCYTNIKTDSIYTTGLMIKGLKTNLLKRAFDVTRTTIQEFVPYNQQFAMSKRDMDLVSKYYSQVLVAADHVMRPHDMDRRYPNEHDFDLDDSKYSLLKYLEERMNATHHQKEDITHDNFTKDMMIGTFMDDFYFPDHMLKPIFDMITRSNWNPLEKVMIEMTEVTSESFNLAKVFQRLAIESIYCDKLEVSYSLLTSDDNIKFDSIQSTGVKSIMSLKGVYKNMTPVDVTVFKMMSQDTTQNYQQIMEKLFDTTKDGGYMIAFHKESRQSLPSIRSVLKDIKITSEEKEDMSQDQLMQYASDAGFSHILTKKLYGKILPFNVMLFRKQLKQLRPERQIIIEVSMTHTNWMAPLKEAMQYASDDQRIWLIPDTKDDMSKSKVTGLFGFVKSLRCEPNADKIRCFIDWRMRCKPDFYDSKYSHLLKNDLISNVYDDDLETWGDYEHFVTPIIESDKTPTEVYLKPLKHGDLTSLVWAESDINKQYTRITPLLPSLGNKRSATQEEKKRKNLVKVNYSPLNFKDVLYATGKLPIDSVSGISVVTALDSLLGLEFSGVDSNGQRIMGSLPYKTLASAVELDEDSFVFPVPDDWSLEDAATVPVVYMTAIYALEICGKLMAGESVLIHAGAGGVGLAAITLCLAKGCDVWTTCGSDEKKSYLKRQFPKLHPDQILYSRDTRFEEIILKKTNGQGVDVILNSLAGDQMKSSLNCLASGGRFLEIGKVDFLADTKLHADSYDSNKTIIGVFLDSFFSYESSLDTFKYQRQIRERKELQRLVDVGIKSGIIKPLKRTVFEMDQVEDAFRFMATGKHVGKILIKIDQDESSDAILRMDKLTRNNFILNQTYFDPSKSYIIIGGLGGFGLEVVQWMAERGARKFLLSSRRGIREPYQRYCLHRLIENFKCDIITTQDPIGTYADVKINLIQRASENLGPVGGYFNIAALYSDSLFMDQSEEMFETSIIPKASVTYYFDIISRKSCPSLDYFVCFSSLSSGRGNPGQGYYNFGNSIMETICERRIEAGLAGLCIQWGVVGDVGEVSEKAGGNGMVLLGCTSQRIPSCLYHLDMFIQSSSDYPVVGSCVLANDSNSDVKETQDVLKLLSRVLGMKNIHAVDPSSTLAALGIDSLMAVEIQQIIERNKGVQMSLKTIREMSIKEFIETAS